MDKEEELINKNAKALTIGDLLAVVKQEKLSIDTKIFLSDGPEGNNIYGMAEFGLEEEKENIILYPYTSEEYALLLQR